MCLFSFLLVADQISLNIEQTDALFDFTSIYIFNKRFLYLDSNIFTVKLPCLYHMCPNMVIFTDPSTVFLFIFWSNSILGCKKKKKKKMQAQYLFNSNTG